MTAVPLSDALFSKTQQKVLGLLFGRPQQSFFSNEIVRYAGLGKGTVRRELDRLQKAGILTLTRQGNQTHYQANSQCPVYPELVAIVRKTFALADVLAATLQVLRPRIRWAFVYGSMAKGEAHVSSDIDLMLIGQDLDYAGVMELLAPVEAELGRKINPTLYTPSDWQARLASGNSFALRVMAQTKINVIGDANDLGQS